MNDLHPACGALLAALLVATAAPAGEHGAFTDDFPLEDCRFVPWGGSTYFSLNPGRELLLSNARCVEDGECADLEVVRIVVTDRTHLVPLRIDGKLRQVRTRVVEEHETENGTVKEISRNYFATCLPMRDVYYFGEDVFDGAGKPLPDAWLAGRRGAEPGMIMPDAAFLLGSRYYQELAPGVALDRAEHVQMDIEVETPAGEFEDCVRIEETTPLQPGSTSEKIYCPRAGLVSDDDLELVELTLPGGGDD